MTRNMLGLLRVRVVRGVNLAYRDARGSDPYVVLRMGSQKVKTKVKKRNVNPEWNQELTLSISEPLQPMLIEVYDKDTFSRDDKMGHAELDLQPFVDSVRIEWSGLPSGTIVKTMEPSRSNCIATESNIMLSDGKVVQDVILRLKDVESGEVELQLHWISIPGGIGFN